MGLHGNKRKTFNFYEPPPQIGFQSGFGAAPQIGFQGKLDQPSGPISSGSSGGGVSQFTDFAAGFGGPVGLGVAAAGRVFDFFGGANKRAREQDKNRKGIFRDLGGFSSDIAGEVGRLNPADLTAKSIAGLQPRIEEFDRLMQERYGFDAGRAGGVLKQKIAELRFGIRPQMEFGAARFDLDARSRAANVKANQGSFI